MSRRDRNDEQTTDNRPYLYQGSNDERVNRVRSFISSLKFSVPLKKLKENNQRTPCPKCNKMRMFYCYDCLVGCNPACNPPTAPNLPVDVHVILHPGETRGKATTLPAASIAPEQVKIHTFPQIPDLKVEETVLLYPSSKAVDISEMSPEELSSVKNIVFIDSTWQQSKKIERDEKVQSFRHVKIPAQETLFWRFQNYDPTYLATIEAIYYALREIIIAKNKHQEFQKIEAANNKEAGKEGSQQQQSLILKSEPLKPLENNSPFYRGECDDLLFYFVYRYLLIQIEFTADQKKEKEIENKKSAQEDGPKKPENESETKNNGKNDNDDDDESNTRQEQEQQRPKEFTNRHFKGYILEGNDFEKFFE